MSQVIVMSLSNPTELRWMGITYNANGVPADPRQIFTPQMQLVVPGSEEFAATWCTGTWDQASPAVGPYSCRFLVGPGATPSVNPGAVGVYSVVGRLYQASGETPASKIGTVSIEAP
jgi:hypothetical protein